MELQHLYRTPGLPEGQRRTLLDTARRLIGPEVEAVDTEHCFNIALARPLPAADHEVLRWLLAETFEPGALPAVELPRRRRPARSSRSARG